VVVVDGVWWYLMHQAILSMDVILSLVDLLPVCGCAVCGCAVCGCAVCGCAVSGCAVCGRAVRSCCAMVW